MANLVMDGVTLASKSGSDVTIQDTNVKFPAGHIVKIVQSLKTNAETGDTTSYADVGDLSATITPSSESNKIMIMIDIHVSGQDENISFWRCVRNGSTFFTNSSNSGAEDGSMWSYYSRTTNFSSMHYQGMRQSFNYLDSPSTTSALTYKIQARVYDSSYPWRCNQGDSVSSSARITPVSSVTLMEIVG